MNKLLAIALTLLFTATAQAQMVPVGCGSLTDFYIHSANNGIRVLRIEPVPETGNSIIIVQKEGPDGGVVAYTLIGEHQCVVFTALPLGPFFGIKAYEVQPPALKAPKAKPQLPRGQGL